MFKKLFFCFLIGVTSLLSCSMYDDTLIWEKLNDHERRLAALEELCEKLNSDVESMQTIIEALQNNDYVTSVTPIYEGDDVIGYTIVFSKSGAVSIYNGRDGKDGSDGTDGENGADGQDGHTPVIGVRQDTDGVYYWTIDGEWLLDENGNKLRVTGKDGQDGADGEDGTDGEDGVDGEDGADGQDGKDGHTPVIGVKQDTDGIYYWTIDGNWLLDENGNKVPTTGSDGQDGSNGADGENGQDGKDGDSFFSSVDTSNGDYVVITLADGTVIKLPTWQAFENLQNTVNQINSNLNALQQIVTALQNNDYVLSVTPIYEGGEVVGYTIIFSKSGAVSIFNGKDGADGSNGSNGTNGQDGHTPVIGVRQDTDGVYYWTIDGEWLLDENGNKLRVTGKDGQDGADGEDGTDGEDGVDGEDGADGQDGKDGHTPVIGVKQDTDGIYYWTIDGNWLLDENGNKVPTTGSDGQDGSNGADGENGQDGKDGDSFFSSVDTSNGDYVVITLADGTVIKLPTWQAFENLQNTVNQINSNLNALQQIVTALQNNDYVLSVTPIYEGGEVVGYTIVFSKSGAVSIFNGKDGMDGSNGSNGTNGQDGHTPVIGVRQDTDGVYYWTIDGEWLLDENGNKLRVTGKDGQDGENGTDGEDGADGENGADGQDGKDGHTPVIGVKQDTDGIYYWTIDGNWLLDENGNKVPTTGADGQDGSNGADGENGQDGKDGDSFFSSVDTSNGDYVVITLADGTVIKLPTWQAFENLQNTVNQINSNLSALQQIVTALQNNDYVLSVTPIYEGGEVVGYTIVFSKSGAVSIFNGKDGKDGSNGSNGTNGQDGHTPVIGVRQDTDGVYYWTIDGEWLLDENGNKLRVTGKDGADGSNGSNGTNGQDGHTPVIGVKQDTDGIYYWTIDGNWLLDENGNKVPTTGSDGQDGSNGADGEDGADGKDGDSFFSSVDTSNGDYVVITLADGTVIKLPTWQAFENLQNTVNQINSNLNALQQIVTALQNNDYVLSVTPIYEGGEVVGYTIVFSKSGAVSIFNGKDGKDGSNGSNGTNGQDGHTPVIGVRQDTDGVYYWTIDGEWLLDENGNKLRVTGKDGADGSNGSNGTNGQDGHTPVIGVKQDTDGIYYWTIDGNWLLDENGNKVPTTGADGQDGSNGADGEDGADGKDGDSFFSSVDTSNGDYVVITLADGTVIKLPTWQAFENLKNTVNQINSNLNALQQIVTALQNNDYVLSVTPIYEGGEVVGYTIVFSKSGAVSIFNGKDGKDGSNGSNGTNGQDGHTPVIGVRQDIDGVYYWTIDGEWLLDENGNKLRVTGKDGQDGADGEDGTDGEDGVDGEDGADGQDGQDGHTPVIGVKQDTDGIYYWTIDGNWLLDENGNKVPTTGADGQDGFNGADGEDGDSFFSSVTEDDKCVYLTLADGTEIVIPKYPKAPITLTLGSVTGFTATFNGTVHQKSLDLKVTVYYSTTPDLTVYKHRGSLAHTEFPEDTFVMKLKELAANTTYYYFVEIIGNGNTSYSEISSFRTTEPDSYIDWGEGENVGGDI